MIAGVDTRAWGDTKATIAIVAEVPIDTLWHAVPAFPILSEVWLRLLETYRNEFNHEYV